MAHADAARRDGEHMALRAMNGVRDGETEMAEQCYLLWMRPIASTLESQPFAAELFEFRAVVTTCTSVLVVSPGNILCGADGSVMLNDWGSARVVGTPGAVLAQPRSLLFVLYRFSAFPRARRDWTSCCTNDLVRPEARPVVAALFQKVTARSCMATRRSWRVHVNNRPH